ncbi:hypothetical protein TWF694_003008 [Orbilia ellipsospora]|uniref:Extracellular membrane protein CFEM domain-containing protein n=1 Tax=Orbilia ellipsospora TaxID=2528407 RepID=A0AAV9X0N9_9PEZI
MQIKRFAFGLLSGIAYVQAQTSSAGQTFTDPALESCGVTCLSQLQQILGCDPTFLSCVCPFLPFVQGNTQFDQCLVSGCGNSGPEDIGKALGDNCGHYSWSASTIGTGTPTTGGSESTSAPESSTTSVAVSTTTTAAPGSSASQSSSPATSTTAAVETSTTQNSSPVTTGSTQSSVASGGQSSSPTSRSTSTTNAQGAAPTKEVKLGLVGIAIAAAFAL